MLSASIARLSRERPEGWAAAVVAQPVRLAAHTGCAGTVELADAVAWQVAAGPGESTRVAARPGAPALLPLSRVRHSSHAVIRCRQRAGAYDTRWFMQGSVRCGAAAIDPIPAPPGSWAPVAVVLVIAPAVPSSGLQEVSPTIDESPFALRN